MQQLLHCEALCCFKLRTYQLKLSEPVFETWHAILWISVMCVVLLYDIKHNSPGSWGLFHLDREHMFSICRSVPVEG
jgi:hypothetical protein